MRYTITGRNIEVTPGLKAAVEKKIGKLEHFFTPDTEVIVALSAQKDRQKIEVTIPVKGNTIRAEESSTDMYVSIDLVEEVIERQIRRYRKKLIDKKQAAVSFSQAFIEEEDEVQDDEIQIVKTKHSRGSMPADGDAGPQLLCIPKRRYGPGQCCLQTQERNLWPY